MKNIYLKNQPIASKFTGPPDRKRLPEEDAGQDPVAVGHLARRTGGKDGHMNMGCFVYIRGNSIRFRLAGPAAEGPGRDQPPVWRPPPLPRPVAERAHRRSQYVIHTPNAPHTKGGGGGGDGKLHPCGGWESFLLSLEGKNFSPPQALERRAPP